MLFAMISELFQHVQNHNLNAIKLYLIILINQICVGMNVLQIILFSSIKQDLNTSTPKKLFFLNKELRRTHACHQLIIRVLRFVYPSNFDVTNEVAESVLGNTLSNYI